MQGLDCQLQLTLPAYCREDGQQQPARRQATGSRKRGSSGGQSATRTASDDASVQESGSEGEARQPAGMAQGRQTERQHQAPAAEGQPLDADQQHGSRPASSQQVPDKETGEPQEGAEAPRDDVQQSSESKSEEEDEADEEEESEYHASEEEEAASECVCLTVYTLWDCAPQIVPAMHCLALHEELHGTRASCLPWCLAMVKGCSRSSSISAAWGHSVQPSRWPRCTTETVSPSRVALWPAGLIARSGSPPSTGRPAALRVAQGVKRPRRGPPSPPAQRHPPLTSRGMRSSHCRSKDPCRCRCRPCLCVHGQLGPCLASLLPAVTVWLYLHGHQGQLCTWAPPLSLHVGEFHPTPASLLQSRGAEAGCLTCRACRGQAARTLLLRLAFHSSRTCAPCCSSSQSMCSGSCRAWLPPTRSLRSTSCACSRWLPCRAAWVGREASDSPASCSRQCRLLQRWGGLPHQAAVTLFGLHSLMQ